MNSAEGGREDPLGGEVNSARRKRRSPGGRGDYEKTALESRKYALSPSGSHGKLRQGGRKTEYYHSSMGRNNLFRPCYGIRLHPSGTVFLPDHPGDRRVCHQPDDERAGVCHGLLRRAFREGCGQVSGNRADGGKGAASEVCACHRREPGQY